MYKMSFQASDVASKSPPILSSTTLHQPETQRQTEHGQTKDTQTRRQAAGTGTSCQSKSALQKTESREPCQTVQVTKRRLSTSKSTNQDSIKDESIKRRKTCSPAKPSVKHKGETKSKTTSCSKYSASKTQSTSLKDRTCRQETKQRNVGDKSRSPCSPQEFSFKDCKKDIKAALAELQKTTSGLEAGLTKAGQLIESSTPVKVCTSSPVCSSQTNPPLCRTNFDTTTDGGIDQEGQVLDLNKTKTHFSPIKYPKTSHHADTSYNKEENKSKKSHSVDKVGETNTADPSLNKDDLRNQKNEKSMLLLPQKKHLKSCLSHSKASLALKNVVTCTSNEGPVDRRNVVKQCLFPSSEDRSIALKATKLNNFKPVSGSKELENDLTVSANLQHWKAEDRDPLANVSDHDDGDGDGDDAGGSGASDSNNNSTKFRVYIGDQDKLRSIQAWINSIEAGEVCGDVGCAYQVYW